ncbi:MAG TPA: lantibiotic dehydratase family protein, partial [Thermoanaerobaculia bacterium]
MSGRSPSTELAAAGFAVLRTPLLPFDELIAWGEGLEAPALAQGAAGETLAAALGRDRERLRQRLRALAERPEVREALFLASPSLDEGLDRWRREPAGKKGRRAEGALVRYLLRMAARPTPFGLFSGCSLIELGATTRLELPPRAACRRRSRLDMDYVFRLSEALGRDPALRRALVWRPTTSLYRAAGRLRYAEAQLRGGARTYHLVAVDAEPFVDAALAAARDGARFSEIVAALVAADPDGEVSAEGAAAFVDELIDSQILVSDLAPLLTGGDAVAELLAVLRAAGAPAATREGLAAAAAALDGLDAAGLGRPPAAYRALAAALEALPAPVELPRLVQVDLIKPSPGASLGTEVVAEIERGVALLARLDGRPPAEDALDRFRRDFAERYGRDREVPLLEALDEESGVGFDRERGADLSPLLDGLDFPAAAPDPRVPWGEAEQRLTARLGEALADGAASIELTEADLAGLGDGDGRPLADGLEVMATVAAASHQALEAGDFRVLVRGVFGPSAARLSARFCHAEPALTERVRGVLAAEEALEPDAVFAEIVHLPEGRIGNIVARPLLREREIPFLGRGGAPPDRQVALADLTVSVAGDRVVLRSAATGRRVLPRLTNAHNFSARGLGLYRFLGALQAQGVRAALGWRWGPLEAFPFLPRVTSGRLVLCRARWALSAAEVAALDAAGDADRYAAVQAWRRRR